MESSPRNVVTVERPETKQPFGGYGAYYDLLYRDKDYASEAAYVERTLRRAAPHAHRLLEFGSGTGAHGRRLASAGFDVTGVDRSAVMVAAAQSQGHGEGQQGGFSCIEGDIRHVRLDGAFDAVISLFHVVSYQVSNDDLRATFANAARHLSAGGVFLFDVWHGPAVLTERPEVRVKRIEDGTTVLLRIAEPAIDTNAGVVTVRYTILAESKADGRLSAVEEEHRMRYLFPTEVDLLAHETGFVIDRLEEFGTGAAATDHTWGVAYLLRRVSEEDS